MESTALSDYIIYSQVFIPRYFILLKNFWWTCLSFFVFFLNFFYCCSSTVVSIPLLHSPCPTHPLLPTLILPLWLCPCVLYTCSLTTLSLFSPIIPLSPSLWLLTLCSLFPCPWFCFAHLFVLLIRFHLQVRSYGICLSLTGLFHLA